MPNERKTSTVLIVDSRELRRAGVVGLMTTWADANAITLQAFHLGEAITAVESVADCRMVVLSIGAQSITARENAQWIKVMRALAPQAPIVIVSDNENTAEVIASLGVGVQGFLPTSMGRELALQAFSFILAGGSYFPPSAIRNMRTQSEERDPEGGGTARRIEAVATPAATSAQSVHDEPEEDAAGATLTHRQIDVLQLLKEGEPNKVIARKLGMTEATVKVHVRHIMRKFGASNRTQAALNACGIDGIGERTVPQRPASVPFEIKLPRVWAAE